MKKNLLRVATYLFVAIMSVGFVSCESDDDELKEENPAPVTPVDPVDPSEGDAMSVAAQKEYLEEVALELMDQMPASDFRSIVNLAQYISETYVDEYDWDNVGDWAADIFEDACKALGTTTKETETSKWDDYTYIYNYFYEDYEALLMAANFTGHFTARNGRWIFEEAKDLQFIFTDNNGKQCVLKLETGGSVKKVHLYDDDEWYDYDSEFDYDSNIYTYYDYYDRIQYTIGVPEEVVLTLTQAGNEVIKLALDIDLSSLSGKEFDLSKSSFNLSASLVLNNGYEFVMEQMAYTANKDAAVLFQISKNKTSLFTLAVAADVNNIPSVNLSAFVSDNVDMDEFDKTNAKNAFVKFDVLNKVQIQGTLTDVRKFIDYMDAADDNDEDEKTFKSYINQANALADVNLFYDGSSVKQATVKLESFVDDYWGGYSYWYAEPVLFFYDGTSYSTFEAFFNNRDFKTTIETFEELIERYENLFD